MPVDPTPGAAPDTDPLLAWADSAPLQEVLRYARDAAEAALILFAAHMQNRDAPGMARQIAALQYVATRLDQYREMKEKQWTAAAPANSKQETKHK